MHDDIFIFCDKIKFSVAGYNFLIREGHFLKIGMWVGIQNWGYPRKIKKSGGDDFF